MAPAVVAVVVAFPVVVEAVTEEVEAVEDTVVVIATEEVAVATAEVVVDMVDNNLVDTAVVVAVSTIPTPLPLVLTILQATEATRAATAVKSNLAAVVAVAGKGVSISSSFFFSLLRPVHLID